MIMKKVLLILGIGLLICVFMAGCADSDAKRIIGTWEYRSPNEFAPLYQKYVFEKDGTGSFQEPGIVTPREFQYKIEEDGTLALTWKSGFTEDGAFAFNQDYSVLSITFDGTTFDYEKAKS